MTEKMRTRNILYCATGAAFGALAGQSTYYAYSTLTAKFTEDSDFGLAVGLVTSALITYATSSRGMAQMGVFHRNDNVPSQNI